jgi:hypothetical protein
LGRSLREAALRSLLRRRPGLLSIEWVDSARIGAERTAPGLADIAWSYPEEIERAILVVEGVAAARVYGKPDPSYSEIVPADLVVNAEFEAADVLKRVHNTLESSLAKYKVP